MEIEEDIIKSLVSSVYANGNDRILCAYALSEGVK